MKTEYPRKWFKASELRLADIVMLNCKDGFGKGAIEIPQAYTCATVIRVTDTEVTFFRPYVQTADFSYTGGVIPYIGIERFSISRDSSPLHLVLMREELK